MSCHKPDDAKEAVTVTWPMLDACVESRFVTDPSGPVLQTETSSPAVYPEGINPIVVLVVVLMIEPVVAAVRQMLG